MVLQAVSAEAGRSIDAPTTKKGATVLAKVGKHRLQIGEVAEQELGRAGAQDARYGSLNVAVVRVVARPGGCVGTGPDALKIGW